MTQYHLINAVILLFAVAMSQVSLDMMINDKAMKTRYVLLVVMLTAVCWAAFYYFSTLKT